MSCIATATTKIINRRSPVMAQTPTTAKTVKVVGKLPLPPEKPAPFTDRGTVTMAALAIIAGTAVVLGFLLWAGLA